MKRLFVMISTLFVLLLLGACTAQQEGNQSSNEAAGGPEIMVYRSPT